MGFSVEKWDRFFWNLCEAVASQSPCLSRKVGAVIARGKHIVSVGYNGPPAGYDHCQGLVCPRRLNGFASGEGLHLCPAVHAEVNAVATAARLGSRVEGCTLYLNTCPPCKDCMAILVNAGIETVVCEPGTEYYDDLSWCMVKQCLIQVRRFRRCC